VPRPSLLPLFTLVRGRCILRTSPVDVTDLIPSPSAQRDSSQDRAWVSFGVPGPFRASKRTRPTVRKHLWNGKRV
jgi:hypothetical protein